MNSIDLWRSDRSSPFSLLRNWDSIVKDMDNFFSEFDKGQNSLRHTQNESTYAPAVDVQEDENGFLMSFDLPGFKKEDVQIELMGNRLSVSGKRTHTASDKKDTKIHRIERSYGEFKRVFALPDNAKVDRVEAHYENGVLYLSVPKAEIEKPKKV